MKPKCLLLFVVTVLSSNFGLSQVLAISDLKMFPEITTTQIVIPNVLANDFVNNIPATLSDVVLTQLDSQGNILLLPDGSVQVGPSSTSCWLSYEICRIGTPGNCATGNVYVLINDPVFVSAPVLTVVTAPTCATPVATIQLDNFPPGDSWIGYILSNHVLVGSQAVVGNIPLIFQNVPHGFIEYGMVEDGSGSALIQQQYLIDPCAILEVPAFDKNQIAVYPNPVTDKLTLTNTGVVDTVIITNLPGQVLLRKTIGEVLSEIDFSTFNTGVYLVTVQGEKGMKTFKVVKQ